MRTRPLGGAGVVGRAPGKRGAAWPLSLGRLHRARNPISAGRQLPTQS